MINTNITPSAPSAAEQADITEAFMQAVDRVDAERGDRAAAAARLRDALTSAALTSDERAAMTEELRKLDAGEPVELRTEADWRTGSSDLRTALRQSGRHGEALVGAATNTALATADVELAVARMSAGHALITGVPITEADALAIASVLVGGSDSTLGRWVAGDLPTSALRFGPVARDALAELDRLAGSSEPGDVLDAAELLTVRAYVLQVAGGAA